MAHRLPPAGIGAVPSDHFANFQVVSCLKPVCPLRAKPCLPTNFICCSQSAVEHQDDKQAMGHLYPATAQCCLLCPAAKMECLEPQPRQITRKCLEPQPRQITMECLEPQPRQITMECLEPQPRQITMECLEPQPRQITMECLEPQPRQITMECLEPQPRQIKRKRCLSQTCSCSCCLKTQNINRTTPTGRSQNPQPFCKGDNLLIIHIPRPHSDDHNLKKMMRKKLHQLEQKLRKFEETLIRLEKDNVDLCQCCPIQVAKICGCSGNSPVCCELRCCHAVAKREHHSACRKDSK